MIFNKIKNSVCSLLAIGLMATPSFASEFRLRLTNTDAPYVQIDDMKYPYYVYGMMTAFGNALDALSKGRIKTEVYHSGTLGDLRENLESVKSTV